MCVPKLVHQVALHHCACTDSDVEVLARFSNLRCLSGNNITDAALAHITALTNISELHLSGGEITQAGLQLANLRKFKFGSFTLEINKHIGSMQNSQDLDLSHCHIMLDFELQHLASLPNLLRILACIKKLFPHRCDLRLLTSLCFEGVLNCPSKKNFVTHSHFCKAK